MRYLIGALAASVVLAGCASAPAPEPPEDEFFDRINNSVNAEILLEEERRLRQAEITSEAQGSNPAVVNDIVDTSQPLTSGDLNEGVNANIAAEIDALVAAEVRAAPASGASETTLAATAMSAEERERISNSQDFEAVTARETIETDAAKLAELRRTYKVFEPESLPTRTAALDLDAFAQENLSVQVGKKRFRRKAADYEGAGAYCLEYKDQDLAQIQFLNQGGPKDDPLLLDADGDGFACSWTPRSHQAKVRASRRAALQPTSPANPVEQ